LVPFFGILSLYNKTIGWKRESYQNSRLDQRMLMLTEECQVIKFRKSVTLHIQGNSIKSQKSMFYLPVFFSSSISFARTGFFFCCLLIHASGFFQIIIQRRIRWYLRDFRWIVGNELLKPFRQRRRKEDQLKWKNITFLVLEMNDIKLCVIYTGRTISNVQIRSSQQQ